MKILALLSAFLLSHRESFAASQVRAVFVADKPFALVLVKGGEVPFYWTHLEKDTPLLPIYSHPEALGSPKPLDPERHPLEKTTPVLLSNGTPFETGTITWRLEEVFTAGEPTAVGGYADLKGRGTSRRFRFDAAATLRLQKNLERDLKREPFVSPRQLVALIDAGPWKSGHYYIIDRDLLPLDEPFYRVLLSDGSPLKTVGTLHSRENLRASALTVPLTGGEALAFSQQDLGIPLPLLWPREPSSPAVVLEYLETTESRAASLGYDLGTLAFSPVDRCVGWLLENQKNYP